MGKLVLWLIATFILIGIFSDALLFIVPALVVLAIYVLAREALRQSKRKPLDIPEGGRYVTVYVYDARPIQRLRPGDRFRIEFIEGVTTMDSLYTDVHWEGECGIRANGQQIGYLTDYDIRFNYISQLMHYYKPVTAQARIKSWTNAGWPHMVLELPSQQWFVDRVKEVGSSKK